MLTKALPVALAAACAAAAPIAGGVLEFALPWKASGAQNVTVVEHTFAAGLPGGAAAMVDEPLPN